MDTKPWRGETLDIKWAFSRADLYKARTSQLPVGKQGSGKENVHVVCLLSYPTDHAIPSTRVSVVLCGGLYTYRRGMFYCLSLLFTGIAKTLVLERQAKNRLHAWTEVWFISVWYTVTIYQILLYLIPLSSRLLFIFFQINHKIPQSVLSLSHVTMREFISALIVSKMGMIEPTP